MDLVIKSDAGTMAIDITVAPPSLGSVLTIQKQAVAGANAGTCSTFVEGAIVEPGVEDFGESKLPTFSVGKGESGREGSASLKDPLGLTESMQRATQRKYAKYGRLVWTADPENPAKTISSTFVPLVIDQAGGIHRPSAKVLQQILQTAVVADRAADLGEVKAYYILNLLQSISTATIRGNVRIWGAHTMGQIRLLREAGTHQAPAQGTGHGG